VLNFCNLWQNIVSEKSTKICSGELTSFHRPKVGVPKPHVAPLLKKWGGYGPPVFTASAFNNFPDI